MSIRQKTFFELQLSLCLLPAVYSKELDENQLLQKMQQLPLMARPTMLTILTLIQFYQLDTE